MPRRDRSGERDYEDDGYYDVDEDEGFGLATWGIIGALSAILVMVGFAATCWWINCPSPMDIGKAPSRLERLQ